MAGFDLTFSAPKSVSVLFGTGDRRVERAIRRSHDRAVVEAVPRAISGGHAPRQRGGRGRSDRWALSLQSEHLSAAGACESALP